MRISQHPIVRELYIHNILLKEIAHKLNVTIALISSVIKGDIKSKRVKNEISSLLKEKRRICPISKFRVYKKSSKIDTVFFPIEFSEDYVKQCLIDQEEFDENIKVRKFEIKR